MPEDKWGMLKDVLKGGAGLIANAVVPGSGGLAATIIGGILGVDPNNPDKMVTALKNAKPEIWAKLKEAEMTHEVALVNIASEIEVARLQDVQNARNREIEITKVTGNKNTNLYVLAWTVIIGFFLLCGILMFVVLPTGSNEVVFMLFGSLATGFGTVLQYFFGSSKSSTDKTQLLASINTSTLSKG